MSATDRVAFTVVDDAGEPSPLTFSQTKVGMPLANRHHPAFARPL